MKYCYFYWRIYSIKRVKKQGLDYLLTEGKMIACNNLTKYLT
jgi:hypothetical protein